MSVKLTHESLNTVIELTRLSNGIGVVDIVTREGITTLAHVADVRQQMQAQLKAKRKPVHVWVVNLEGALLTYPGQRLADVLKAHKPKSSAAQPTAMVVRREDAQDFQAYARGMQVGGFDRIIFSARERASALSWAHAVLDSQAVALPYAQPTE